MKRLISIITIMTLTIFSLIVVSCSENDIRDFQRADLERDFNNVSEGDVELFSLLEDYPSIENAFGSIEEHQFNQYINDFRGEDPTDHPFILKSFEHVYTLLTHEEHPLPDIMGNIREIITRVITQNEIGVEPAFPYSDYPSDGNYRDDLYSFYDQLNGVNTGIAGDLLELARKAMGYINDTYGVEGCNDLENIMIDLNAFLIDNEGSTVGSIIDLMSVVFGKLLLAANEDMWLDINGDLITDRSEIPGETNLYLGNSARGVESLLSGVNSLLKIPSIRDDIYDIIREVGGLTSAKGAGGKGLKDVFRELICNLEDYSTVGGEIYEGNGGDNEYHRDTASEYVNMELGNTISEIMPALTTILLRGDRADSIIEGDIYPLGSIARGFNRMNLDMESLNIEESLYKMIRYDDKMRDRMADPDASNLSALEKLIFLLTFANNFGYYKGGDTGEGNHGRGHGEPTGGILSLNDILFNLTTADKDTLGHALGDKMSLLGLLDTILGILRMGLDDFLALFGTELNVFGLAFDNPPGDLTHRNKDPFNAGECKNFPYYISPNHKILTVANGETVGDLGAPDGGMQTDHTWDSFVPYSEDGLGEVRTAPWMMGWIARVCWEGQGPYYSIENGTIDGDGYSVYKSPNGSVYARVDKSGGAPGTWSYHDCRYKTEWNTDYYMIELEDVKGNARYYPLDNEVYYNGSSDKTVGLSDKTEAGCLTMNERNIINADRECLTHEEAMYKNFQWLLYEKKMLLILPLRIEIDINILIKVQGKVAVYLVIDTNGLLGLLNCRKSPSTDAVNGNSRWVLDGGYGNISNEPGDYRITVMLGGNQFRLKIPILMDKITFDVIDLDFIYNTVLGNGHLVPDAIGTNIGALKILSFMTADTVTSENAGIAGANWGERNALLPVFITLLGTLHENSSRDLNKYPFVTLANGLFPLLAKPLMYYQKDSGSTPYNCWKPRLEDGHDYLKAGVALGSDWGSTWPINNEDWLDTIESYYQPMEIRTLIGMLSENEVNHCDGLISLLPETNLITDILELFKKLGDSRYDDPLTADSDDYRTWGERRRMFYGLEQIVSTIKSREGEAIARDYIDIDFPSWMFTDYGKRDEDVDLETITDELIGSDITGKGIAVLPDYRDPDHPAYRGYDWINYERLLDSCSELLSSKGNTGGQYNIMDKVINMMDKLLTSVDTTDNHIRGLRHTLGSVFAEYRDGNWNYPQNLKFIVTDELPKIIDVFNGGYNDLMNLLLGTEDWDQGLLSDDGLISYMLDSLDSEMPASEFFVDIEAFLRFIGEDPQCDLWDELADFIDSILVEWGVKSCAGWFDDDIIYRDKGTIESSPFITMGEILVK